MKIALTRVIPPPALERLARLGDLRVWREDRDMSREELSSWETDAEILCSMLTNPIDGPLLDRRPRTRLIANYAVGYNNIDLEEAKKRGVAVTNTPGVLTDSTADLTLALILDVSRRITEGDRLVRRGEFQGITPLFHLGRGLTGKTLGIYGLGRIGAAAARRALPFGLRVIYHNRRPNPELERELGVRWVSLDDLLAHSDIISINAPLTPETKHRFTIAEFKAMKPGAFIVNTGRGPIIKEADLAEALSRGLIAGAGLDVYEFEPQVDPGLIGRENVVLAPHLGSATLEVRAAMADLVADNVEAFIQGRPLPHRVA
ncbi:MAG: D-glycerate dehydrogenase [Pseudomonadota bacterium]